MIIYMVRCMDERKYFCRRYDADCYADTATKMAMGYGHSAQVYPIIVDGDPEPSIELEVLRAEVPQLKKARDDFAAECDTWKKATQGWCEKERKARAENERLRDLLTRAEARLRSEDGGHIDDVFMADDIKAALDGKEGTDAT